MVHGEFNPGGAALGDLTGKNHSLTQKLIGKRARNPPAPGAVVKSHYRAVCAVRPAPLRHEQINRIASAPLVRDPSLEEMRRYVTLIRD